LKAAGLQERARPTVSEIDLPTARRFSYREALLTLSQDPLYPAEQPSQQGATPHEAWSNRPRAVAREDAEMFSFPIAMATASATCLAAVGATIVTHDGNPAVVWRLDQLGRWLNELVTLVQRPKERASLEDRRKPDPSQARMVRHVLEALAQHESDTAGRPVQVQAFSTYRWETVCAAPLI
jgi:hypothetical protein